MRRIGLTGLLKIEFPTRTVRLCDGGFFVWGSETYRDRDDVFGVVSALEGLGEGIGDEVPALRITMMPPGATAPSDLSQPGFQTSRTRLWIAEYDADTGLIDGTPDLKFDGFVDQTTITRGRSTYSLDMTIVADGERLFQRNIGNSLNPAFHQSVWPGETGENNATGLGRAVAWGVESPPSAYAGGGGGSFNVWTGKWADMR